MTIIDVKRATEWMARLRFIQSAFKVIVNSIKQLLRISFICDVRISH